MCQMEAEFFHADGRTDRMTNMTKLIVAFDNFAYAPKKFGLMKILYIYIYTRLLPSIKQQSVHITEQSGKVISGQNLSLS